MRHFLKLAKSTSARIQAWWYIAVVYQVVLYRHFKSQPRSEFLPTGNMLARHMLRVAFDEAGVKDDDIKEISPWS
jgi:hypothetical protein